MAKRFTDTEKYRKPFLRSLPGAYKLLWDYICNECNHAGIWIADFEIAQLCVGKDMLIGKDKAFRLFNDGETRILEIENGKKWFIIPFVEFQYGHLTKTNPAHKNVILELQKYGFINEDLDLLKDLNNNNFKAPLKELKRGFEAPQEKEKEKEKEKKGVQGEIFEGNQTQEITNPDLKQNSNREIPTGQPIDPHPALGPYHPKQKFLQRECAEICFSDQMWLDLTMLQFRIPDQNALREKILEFFKSNGTYGHTEQKTIKDFKAHFANWLRKQQSYNP